MSNNSKKRWREKAKRYEQGLQEIADFSEDEIAVKVARRLLGEAVEEDSQEKQHREGFCPHGISTQGDYSCMACSDNKECVHPNVIPSSRAKDRFLCTECPYVFRVTGPEEIEEPTPTAVAGKECVHVKNKWPLRETPIHEHEPADKYVGGCSYCEKPAENTAETPQEERTIGITHGGLIYTDNPRKVKAPKKTLYAIDRGLLRKSAEMFPDARLADARLALGLLDSCLEPIEEE